MNMFNMIQDVLKFLSSKVCSTRPGSLTGSKETDEKLMELSDS